MFRFVSLAWDDTQPTISARAHEFSEQLRSRAGWHVAFQSRGLEVHTVGNRQGVNGIYPLPAERGTVVGKLFRRRELHSPCTGDLSLTASEAGRILDGNGRGLVQEFWGRYVAFVKSDLGTTNVLRDPSGTLPCFLMQQHGISLVFSWLEDVLELRSLQRPKVNWDGLQAHLTLGELGGRETTLEGVSQILPGEVVELATGRSVLLWNAIQIAQSPLQHDAADAAQALHSLVSGCALAWAACYDTILFRLSGGVDSAILLSCLANGRTASDVVCLNYHSPGADSDERGYARLAALRAGRDLVEREREKNFRLERLLQIARMPSPVSYVGRLTAGADARLAQAHSATALFTGGGGDQLFFEFPCAWPAADYLRLRGIDGGFASAVLDAARLGKVSVWNAAAMAFIDRMRPTVHAPELASRLGLLGQRALEKAPQRERFVHPALLRATALPIGKRTQAWALMHPIGYYDPFEQASAPELVNPLLSQPLVELCLRLPTFLLTQGGSRSRTCSKSLRTRYSA